ncbi:MAG: hypothetical protein M3T55_09875 [Pseudomonadota bacterium]|nr:hypothetical protein [Pseudomonadota bacterium]
MLGYHEFGNDESYLRWLSDHPNGFVLNTRKEPAPRYMVLHSARCTTISLAGAPYRESGYTERAYRKICSNEISNLRTWVRCHGRLDGSFSKECRKCTPVE